MQKFGLSQPVRRVEDQRFLRGQGRYIDDIAPDGAAQIYFLRSPVAHGRITSLNVEDARAADGVLAVYTAADLVGHVSNSVEFQVLKMRDGSTGAAPRRPMLAIDKVCFAGEAVAAIVATTLAQARDAAELIELDIEDLPAHVATAPGGETIHPEAPGNIAFNWDFGDQAATEAAFAAAAHHVSLDLVDNRVLPNPLEPRGCYAEMIDGRLHLAFAGQGVWVMKRELATALGMAPEDVRITNPDVGGGFGMKSFPFPEYFIAAHAARQLCQPVRWMADRTESHLADCHGRDIVSRAEAAFDDNHRLTGFRLHSVSNLGAHNSGYAQFIQTELHLKVLTGIYDLQTVYFTVQGVFTNTAPVDAYRGAGRPEAIYVIERLMDMAARQMGVDPITLRRRNYIAKHAFPYRTASGELYDVGDFDRVLDRAVELADVAGFPARRRAAAERGKLLGLGLSFYIESILGAPDEDSRIVFADDGMVEIYVGTQSNGQGHETVFKQFLHDRAGIPFDRIRFVQGDSDRIARGGGTGGSRSVTVQGNAINEAADILIAKFRPLAEEELEVASADIEFTDGEYRVAGTDRSVSLMALADQARRAGRADLLITQHTATLPARSYPNGAHFAEVEVDPDTGQTRCTGYWVVDDFGRLMNPMLAEGQVHGGVAQGIGQAITEQVVYDEDGQLLSGSLMDYAMPRADDLPNIVFTTENTPSTANAMGMKGCGEAGTVGALAAIANAALDAVWDEGVRHVDMPLTPLRMWEWLQAAKAG